MIRGYWFLGAIIFLHTSIMCMQEYVQQLTPENPYTFFNLAVSDEQLHQLSQLKVPDHLSEKVSYLNIFGSLHTACDQIKNFFQSLENNAIEAGQAAQTVITIIHQVCHDVGMPSAWVAIRTFKKNNDLYHIPRWHVDTEQLFPMKHGYMYKVTYALKGRQTLFCPVPCILRAQLFGQRYMKISELVVRKTVHDLMCQYEHFSANYGQAAIFLMGDASKGAVHTEPLFDSDRIFMSIVPGSQDDIAYLERHWALQIKNRFQLYDNKYHR